MIRNNSTLSDCFIIEPRVFKDERGYFFESFHQDRFEKLLGHSIEFVQDNQSFSTRGVLRGIHFQNGDHAQAKLVRIIQGEVLDVAVDLRPDSPTYLHHFKVILSGENHKQLFIPRGFGHGFLTLSDTAIFVYKCDNYYHKDSEGGLRYDDPKLGIDWGMNEKELLVNDKDLKYNWL